MSTQGYEIFVGVQWEFLKGPLASAQDEVLAAYKAAGNDLAGLATKAGTSIAFLQVTGARIVSSQGGNALVFSMAVETGKYTGSFLTESRRCQTRVNVLHPYTSWRGAGVQSGRRRRSGDPSRVR